MSKKIRSFLSFAIVLVMAFAVMSLSAFAADDVAKIGNNTYPTLADAIANANAGDTITLLDDVIENVTIDESLTIDGNNCTFTGNMSLKANTTIKNVNFDGKGYNGYAIDTRGANYLTIEDCTAQNYGYGFVQLASATTLTTLKNVTISNVNYGVKVDYSNAVIIENVDIDAKVAGILNSNYGEKTITVKNSDINIIGTWARNNTIKSTILFEGHNTVDRFVIDANIDIFKLAEDASLTTSADLDITTDAEGYEVVYENGAYSAIETVKVAEVGGSEYKTLAAAIEAANAGDTITLMSDIELTSAQYVEKQVTIDLGGHTLSAKSCRALISNGSNACVTVKNGTVESGVSGALTANYKSKLILGEKLTVKSTGNFGVYVNRGKLEVTESSVYVEGAAKAIGIKAHDDNELVIKGGTYSDAVSADFIPDGYTGVWNADSKYMVVGVVKVEDVNGVNYYANLAEAAEAATDGAVITLIGNLSLNADDAILLSGKYPSFMVVGDKTVTLELNGKTVSVDMTDMTGTIVAFASEGNGHLVVNDSKKTGSITADGAAAYSLFSAFDSNSKLTINAGSFSLANALDCLVHSAGNETVTVNGGSFILGNVGTGTNGKPWIFNANGQNTQHVNVVGGSFNADVLHQHWNFEVSAAKTLALSYADGMYTFVPAGAYLSEKHKGYINEVGYVSFADAFEAAKDGEKITLLATDYLYADELVDFDGEYLTFFEINDKTLTIDLNGYMLQGIIKGAEKMVVGMFATNDNGHLILEDSSADQSGRVKVSSQGATLYALLVNYEPGCSIVVNGGNYYTNKAYDCLVYSGTSAYEGTANEGVVINGGTFDLGNLGTKANGSPWLFNVLGQNHRHIWVNGGSFSADVFHQYYVFEVQSPEDIALKYNAETGMYDTVDAVAYVTERHWSSKWYTKNVGYATLEEAIAACEGSKTVIYYNKAYTSEPEKIVMLKDIVAA